MNTSNTSADGVTLEPEKCTECTSPATPSLGDVLARNGAFGKLGLPPGQMYGRALRAVEDRREMVVTMGTPRGHNKSFFDQTFIERYNHIRRAGRIAKMTSLAMEVADAVGRMSDVEATAIGLRLSAIDELLGYLHNEAVTNGPALHDFVIVDDCHTEEPKIGDEPLDNFKQRLGDWGMGNDG